MGQLFSMFKSIINCSSLQKSLVGRAIAFNKKKSESEFESEIESEYESEIESEIESESESESEFE